MTVVLHEINHGFQKTAPSDYREFRDYAVQAITRLTKGAAQPSIAEQYQKRYGGISKDKAMDEIAADFTEYILTDEATLRQFINDHVNDKNKRNVAQRFFDSVRNFINKVKSIFKGNKAAMDEATVNEFGATVAELEKAEKL